MRSNADRKELLSTSDIEFSCFSRVKENQLPFIPSSPTPFILFTPFSELLNIVHPPIIQVLGVRVFDTDNFHCSYLKWDYDVVCPVLKGLRTLIFKVLY